jgi:N-acetylneuraminic acid mutarotase
MWTELGDAAAVDRNGHVGLASNWTAAAYRYDPASNTWSRIADYPTAMGIGGCGGIDDSVVCAGGAVNVNGHSIPSSDTYVYHPTTDAWTRAADMPYTVFNASYSSANGELQVAGGFTWSRYPFGAVSDVNSAVQYDPIANVWTNLPSAPQAVEAAGKGTGRGLSLIGGSSGSSLSLSGTAAAAALPGFGQCTGDDVSWLSENKATLELAPGHSTRIRVTADAKTLVAPGSYAATLSMITDSPYIYQPVRVTLHAATDAAKRQ